MFAVFTQSITQSAPRFRIRTASIDKSEATVKTVKQEDVKKARTDPI